MEPNRSENNSNQHQNVHLHMHHLCNCQSGLFPGYFPTMGFRTPLPPFVSYPSTSAMSRPYLQHYQYTQFNVGGQYTVPASTPLYCHNPNNNAIDVILNGNSTKDKGDEFNDAEKQSDGPEAYDCGPIAPAVKDLLITDASEQITPDNFVKFLERGCLTAEQVAYRNRNRPCFRNIQNLCIRTRTEILKPCTTISNIHSQGIPWATKDFIYAFVRLTNCWHILKGYWENREGPSLGKIEKELTPEFRSCYLRWEKETIELAAQLTRIFYNLDTNLNSTSSGANVYSANNLIPPQVNLTKSGSDAAIRKATEIVAGTNAAVRGVLRLPPKQAAVSEIPDMSKQTVSTELGPNDEEYDSEEERTKKTICRVYMKPGSYSVPKRPDGGDCGMAVGSSPRTIEFLETAQNVTKAREMANDRYWTNRHVYNAKNSQDNSLMLEDGELNVKEDGLDLTELKIHEWLISNDFGEPFKLQSGQPDPQSIFMDNVYDSLLDGNQFRMEQQRSEKGNYLKINCDEMNAKLAIANAQVDDLRRSRKQKQKAETSVTDAEERKANPYEIIGGGLTGLGRHVLANLVVAIKGNMLGPVAAEKEIDFSKILRKLQNGDYLYVNEVIRDLRCIIKLLEEVDASTSMWFSQKLDLLLEDVFPAYDFDDVNLDVIEIVGPLKIKISQVHNSDCDQLI
ncbi:uncharacterized protein LOC132699613 isoform X2 [Cylas formicarius]|uniref:uncharacterized protein LOC132699613 isoform X2 n=1 Tax=Cylas formicarius TaxID=197179 RepID=UPI0029589F1F|nr:uncharacterized protein LOC132699613 isoform X2 [Cylas formicarius]